jgi:membrane-associated protease RseP (regulator of RpoE activity)
MIARLGQWPAAARNFFLGGHVMRSLYHSLVLASGVLIAVRLAPAQEALERLEKKQFGQGPAAAGAEKADPRAVAAAEPGYLGVVTDDRDDRGRGVRITEIVKDSPAQAAGLKIGDLVTAINGKPVRQMTDVSPLMKNATAGSKLGITVVRDGETRTMAVTLGRRPNDPKLPPPPPAGEKVPPPPPAADQPPAKPRPDIGGPPPRPEPPAAPAMLGVVMRSYADDPRFVLGRPPVRGVQVTDVLPDSPAAAAGLRPGDIVTAVDDRATTDREELRAAISTHRAGEEVELTYYRGRLLMKQKVRLAAARGIEAPPLDGLPEVRRPIEVPSDDQRRIDALEKRVRELEGRIEALEKKLPKGAE